MDSITKRPVVGALIALEQPDTNKIDRIVESTVSDASGNFSFASLAEGTYDIVADASVTSSGSNVTYAPTVTYGVPVSSTVKQIPLEPQYGTPVPDDMPVRVPATVTSAGTLGIPVSVDIKLSALLFVPSGAPVMQITTPVFSGSTPSVTTVPNPSCESGTACVNYVLSVPAGNISFATFNPPGSQYTLAANQQPEELSYTFDGKSFVHGNESSPDCTPASQSDGQVTVRGTLALKVPNFTFTGCS
jgi:hypothetical protein